MRAGIGLSLIMALTAVPVHAADPPPPVFDRCRNCHGLPGDGGTLAAPDLAESRLGYRQFKLQVVEGSFWKGKPEKIWKYRHKEMPKQGGISDGELRHLYYYIAQHRVEGNE